MRRVKFTSAVKMDRPYIIADMNAELTLDDTTAAFAVHNKLGEYVGAPLEVGPTRAELEAQEEARIGTLKRLAEGPNDATWNDPGSEPDGQPVPEVAGAPNSPEPKRPYGNAPKSAWIKYAVDMSGIRGCPEITIERAEEMSKADLMSRYGARLGEED